MAYSIEVRERAENLFVVEGMKYDQIALATGVCPRQLKHWSKKEDWLGKRAEVRRANRDSRRNMALLRSRLLAKACETLDLQTITTLAGLERAVDGRSIGEALAGGGLADSEHPMKPGNPQDIVEALRTALAGKMSSIASRPHKLASGDIKEVAAFLDAIERLEARYLPKEKPKGLSKETVEEIRRKILGLDV